MQERVKNYTAISQALKRADVNKIMSTAIPIHRGIGGESFKADFCGSPIFVKSVPLTNLEMQTENIQSTANLFSLPMFYHYGVGSTGFSAWRELAALLLVTDWVKTGLSPNFPMLFHWCILNGKNQESAFQLDDIAINKDVQYWDNSIEIKHRLLALKNATSRLVLFCEYFPMTLEAWLSKEVVNISTAENAINFVDKSLRVINDVMAQQNMVHFDAHFRNIVTDGTHLIISDFGLALSSRFELSIQEKDFLNSHKNYDRAISALSIVHTVLTQFLGRDTWNLGLRDFLNGSTNALPNFFRSTALKYGEVALIMDDFFSALQKKSKSTPFPNQQIDTILQRRI